MKKKKELIIILGSLLVVVLSVSIAYFTTTINSKNSHVSTSSAELKIVFTSGTGTIAGAEIEPGWSSGVNTFTVKNQSNGTYKYNIVIKDLINTFVTTGYLQYKITSTDGGYNMSDFKDVPKSSVATDTILAYSVEIAKGATHTYSVEFRYLNSTTVNQNEDMGKTLSGTLFIEEGTTEPIPFYNKLLADNSTIRTRSSFSAVFTTTNTGTLYKATESIAGGTAKDVYYFAGNARNNWVKFAGFYWRIIRTNHDGSVRLLYSGTSPETTSGYIGTSAFNSLSDDPMYVGFMYGTDGTLASNRTNENNSKIKTYIDNWYSKNLSSYSKYISTEAVYCNDRKAPRYNASRSFDYYVYTRLNAGNPTYNCEDSKDAFSGSNSEAKLTYPIGLMTTDEITYAGGYKYTELVSPYAWYYLNSAGGSITGSTDWRLLSPRSWDGNYSGTWRVLGSGGPGYLGGGNVSFSSGVRPAFSLKTCALWTSGNGAPETPYEISTTSGC